MERDLRRWLITEGNMGRAPKEYFLFKAADRLHCSPWEVEERSVYWRNWALLISRAENEAEYELSRASK